MFEQNLTKHVYTTFLAASFLCASALQGSLVIRECLNDNNREF